MYITCSKVNVHSIYVKSKEKRAKRNISWSTHLETKWFNRMHYRGNQISAQKKTMTTKTL